MYEKKIYVPVDIKLSGLTSLEKSASTLQSHQASAGLNSKKNGNENNNI